MGLMTSRKLIWYPRPGNNKRVFWIVLFAIVILSILGMKTMPALKGFAELNASNTKYFLWSAVLLIANTWLVYQRARHSYFHPNSAWLPSFITVTLLSALLAISIVYMHGRGTELNGWLKILFTSEGMLTGLLFVASLWNSDEPSLVHIGNSIRQIAKFVGRRKKPRSSPVAKAQMMLGET